jgi:phage gpG-like protein
MKSQMSTRYNMSKIQVFVKSLDQKHKVQVGIFGNKSGRNKGAITNAELGAIHEFGSSGRRGYFHALMRFAGVHEFGSFSGKVPSRSFLRMPISTQSGQIVKETTSTGKGLIAAGKMVLLLKRLGIACENAVQRAFESRGFGTWAPNTPATIRRKQGHSEDADSPLIDTGQLRRSVASSVVAI